MTCQAQALNVRRLRIGPGRSRRAATLAAVTIGHALVLLAIMLTTLSVSTRQGGALTTIALAAVTSEPADPARTAEQRPVIATHGPESARASGSSSPLPADAQGAACSPLERLATALSDDPAVRAALAGVPAETGTFADAIVIWSARWHESAGPADGALTPLRSVIEQTIVTLPEACVHETVIGPRFLVLEGGESNVTLVFGSGEWAWAQLLTPDLPAAGADEGDTFLEQIFSGFQRNP